MNSFSQQSNSNKPKQNRNNYNNSNNHNNQSNKSKKNSNRKSKENNQAYKNSNADNNTRNLNSNNRGNNNSGNPNNKQNRNKKNRDYSNVECYNCHAFGHIARNSNKAQVNAMNPQLALTYDNEDGNSKNSYNNNSQRSVNTISTFRFAPSKINMIHVNGLNGSKLPLISAQIYGTRISALLDSGASVCTLSQTLAKTLGIKFDNDKSKVELVAIGVSCSIMRY